MNRVMGVKRVSCVNLVSCVSRVSGVSRVNRVKSVRRVSGVSRVMRVSGVRRVRRVNRVRWVRRVIDSSVCLKKNGSIDTGTSVTPSTFSNRLVVKSWLRRNVTPCGKFAGSGVLFALKTP